VFTLYSEEGTDTSGMIDVALERIQVSMEQGAFDHLDLRLVAVRFRTEALSVVPSSDNNGTTVETQPAQAAPSTVPVWAWVLIGVAIAILNCIMCFFICRRRKQSNELNADSNDDYDDEDANDQGPRKSRMEQRDDNNDDSSYDLGGGSNMFNPSRGGYSHQVGGDPNETMLMMNSIGNL
jgi:flagellar biosynthesis/type III secretory pathway M-ring protein FliF/YscJ